MNHTTFFAFVNLFFDPNPFEEIVSTTNMIVRCPLQFKVNNKAKQGSIAHV